MFVDPLGRFDEKRPGRSIPRRQSAGWSSRPDGRGDELRFQMSTGDGSVVARTTHGLELCRRCIMFRLCHGCQ